MRTTKPIATISFNTPEYLAQKMTELLKSGRVSFWAFIRHKAEDDEGGKKDHCHLYVEPSKMLQTDDLKDALKEFDPTNPTKPLGCITFKSSKFDPWYLYALHDKRYLASKGQARRYHYKHDDIVTSDPDDLLYKARSIDMVSLSPYADMEDAQQHGLTFSEYFARGTIPLPQLTLFERAWHLLIENRTERNGYEAHPNDLDEEVPENEPKTALNGKIDTDTGEVIVNYTEVDPETGEVIETLTESPENAPELPKVKSDDALRIELINEACKGIEVPRPSFYEVHPQAKYVELDPDDPLPW